uniref:Factor VIII intron 22 protein n=1 Tax=Clastoptera arizonana TaxID=38151 RepID=A0A1B6E0R3_9HEMI
MAEDCISNIPNFWTHYRLINNKLKKRFLRKPNIAECCEQFGQLSIQCLREDIPLYSGLCYIAASQCESQLNNFNGEAWAQVNAGQLFLKAHIKEETLKLLSPGGGEQLEAALSLFQSSENIWKKNKYDGVLAASLYLQIASDLLLLTDKYELSAEYFDKASKLLSDSPHNQLHALLQLATCKLKMGHHIGALDTFNEIVSVVNLICEEPYGVYSDIILRCEINRIMLLLLIRPPLQRLAQPMTAVLEKYNWLGDKNKSPGI